MKRVFLTIGLWLAALGFMNAQEAFYIYRNDNDFNGFFYDEVKEMRQSKVGIDSLTYDHYVTQEIVLKDTTYRIPLCVIDSISFVQPEIKFNPKVRFIERDGYSPYLASIGIDGKALRFENLPGNLTPKVGDVLLGLPTDEIAQTIYRAADTTINSFSCVVEEVTSPAGEPDVLIVSGQPVSDYRQVFDQFITVEQFGVDKNGKVVTRRIAGCHPDGTPRKSKDEEDIGTLKLIDFTGTIQKSWEQEGSISQVDVSAETHFTLSLRGSYNISWLSSFIKVSPEVTVETKPTLGMNISGAFEFPGGWDKYFPIPIPSTCAVFEMHPIPVFFVRGSGSFRISLELPKVYVGMGLDFYITNNPLLPVQMGLPRWVPNANPDTTSLLDQIALDVSMEGFVGAGIKFNNDITTASWYEGIMSTRVGLDTYIGPKLSAKLNFNTNMVKEDIPAYSFLSSQYAALDGVAIDFEAKYRAKFPLMDPKGDTFLSKSWAFFSDTLRMVPTFAKTEIDSYIDSIDVTLIPNRDRILLDDSLYVGAFESLDDLYAPPYKKYGGWALKDSFLPEHDYWATIDYMDLKGGYDYYFGPYVKFANTPIGFNLAKESEKRTAKIICRDTEDSVFHFPAEGGLSTIVFRSNGELNEEFDLYTGSWCDSCGIYRDTIDETKSDYFYLTCRATPNKSFFMKRKENRGYNIPMVTFSKGDLNFKFYYGKFEQDDYDVRNIRVAGYASFYDGEMSHTAGFEDGDITAYRVGSDTVQIEGTFSTILNDGSQIRNQFIQLTIVKIDADWYSEGIRVSGSIRQEIIEGTTTVDMCDIKFRDLEDSFFTGSYFNIEGSETFYEGTHYRLEKDEDENLVPKTYTLSGNESDMLRITFYFFDK